MTATQPQPWLLSFKQQPALPRYGHKGLYRAILGRSGGGFCGNTSRPHGQGTAQAVSPLLSSFLWLPYPDVLPLSHLAAVLYLNTLLLAFHRARDSTSVSSTSLSGVYTRSYLSLRTWGGRWSCSIFLTSPDSASLLFPPLPPRVRVALCGQD